MIRYKFCYSDVNGYICGKLFLMGLVTKKSECKRRVDYMSQLEAELENLLFRKDIKSCRILSHKDIEKKAVKKSVTGELKTAGTVLAIINNSFEDIGNNDRTFLTRISKN